MEIRWAAGTSKFASLAAAALLAASLAACSVGGGESTAAPVKTVTATAPASQAPAANSSATAPQANSPAPHDNGGSAGPSASPAKELQEYRPSTVVSQSSSSTVLKSPDSVTKIGEFYKSVLADGGWDTTSASTGSFHASFTAHRANEGVSISVYPRFGGSGISISQYRV